MKVVRALAAERGALFIVGSCKNAGKTTLLNFLARELYPRLTWPLALLTIGRDGEAVDAVWGHPKPPVRLWPGNLFVTVEPEIARLGADVEMVEPLPWRTPLGVLAIGRARRETAAEIIGPETNAQLWQTLTRLREIGAAHQLVDGAFERRTQTAAHQDARLALVVSADVATSPEKAAAWLAHETALYDLPRAADADEFATAGTTLGWQVRGEDDATTAYCHGPLTDGEVEAALDRLRGARLVIEDATKVFVRPALWRKLARRVTAVQVRRRLRLTMVATNPHGLRRRFDAREFFDAIAAACPDRAVVDVVAGLAREPE